MSMRNTLLTAAAFIVVMVVALIYFGKGTQHGMLIAEEEAGSSSISDAREAYWQQDLLKAERLYRILTKSENADIDAWGELGNLYYMQARWKEAANAYAEVALRLIDKKEMQQAAFFHRLVSQMDRDQSARIDEHLRSLNMAQDNNASFIQEQ